MALETMVHGWQSLTRQWRRQQTATMRWQPTTKQSSRGVNPRFWQQSSTALHCSATSNPPLQTLAGRKGVQLRLQWTTKIELSQCSWFLQGMGRAFPFMAAMWVGCNKSQRQQDCSDGSSWQCCSSSQWGLRLGWRGSSKMDLGWGGSSPFFTSSLLLLFPSLLLSFLYLCTSPTLFFTLI